MLLPKDLLSELECGDRSAVHLREDVPVPVLQPGTLITETEIYRMYGNLQMQKLQSNIDTTTNLALNQLGQQEPRQGLSGILGIRPMVEKLLPKHLIEDLAEGDNTSKWVKIAMSDRGQTEETIGQAFARTEMISGQMAMPSWAFSSMASFTRWPR